MSNFFPDLFAELWRIYETNPEKARKIQNFLGFSSLTEGQVYPTNAKYFLSLDGLEMGLDSRSKDKSLFNLNARECIREMREAGIHFRSTP